MEISSTARNSVRNFYVTFVVSTRPAYLSLFLLSFQDSELLLNMFADELEHRIDRSSVSSGQIPMPSVSTLFDAVHATMAQVQGGYAVVVLIKGVGMLIFRDPHGIRFVFPRSLTRSPLCFGVKRDETGQIVEFAAASESIALEAIGIERERDVNAGESLFIDMEMNLHSHIDALAQTLQPCIFEYVYLARPDSVMDNISVYEARVQMGIRLAERLRTLRVLQSDQKLTVLEPSDAGYAVSLPPLEQLIDCVMAVPDTSRHTAISVRFRGDCERQVATSLGKRYIEGLSKNRYIARTFIMPAQQMRQRSIRIKHNPIHVKIGTFFVVGCGEGTVGAGGGRLDRARQHHDDAGRRHSSSRCESRVCGFGGAANSILQRVWHRYAHATRTDRLPEDRKGGRTGYWSRFRALSELGRLETGVSRCGVV